MAAQQGNLHSPLVFQLFLPFAFAGQQDPRSAPGAAPDAEGFAVRRDLLETFDFTRSLKYFQSNLPAPAPLPQALLLHVGRNYMDSQGSSSAPGRSAARANGLAVCNKALVKP